MAIGTTKNRKRGGGPRALAASLDAITKPVFGKRGFAEQRQRRRLAGDRDEAARALPGHGARAQRAENF